jgi:hypothetical protein
VISAALTPLLSPYRLAADSQFRMALANGLEAPDGRRTALHYLRFDAGQYGRTKLEQLAQLHSGPNAADIRRRAEDMLAQTSSWMPSRVVADIPALLAKLRIFPAGRMLDRDLTDKLTADLGKPGNVFDFERWSDAAVGIYVDLNGDKSDSRSRVRKSRGSMGARGLHAPAVRAAAHGGFRLRHRRRIGEGQLLGDRATLEGAVDWRTRVHSQPP